MPPLFRIFLGLLTAYVLVSLFYAHLEDDARAALRKDALSKAAAKQLLAREKHQQDSVAERRHNDLVGALRTERQGTAGTSKASQPPPPVTNASIPANFPSVTTQTTTAKAVTPQSAQVQPSTEPRTDRLQASLTWLLPALTLLGLALLLGFAWIGWRERQNKLLVPDRFERDTPLLELLLGAFAGPIGRVLPIPRQVKRFASKARLQHNLLHALAKNTQQLIVPTSQGDVERLENELGTVQFGPGEQVLAILLLLLLEEEIVRESRSKLEQLADDAAPMYLRETSPDEFIAKLRALFIRWHETGTDTAVYARFRRVGGEEVPTYAQLRLLLESDAGVWLLMQLHRLNAGLLV
ncbi:hypothetical protein [uncultured Hymenobacter sp.]|uniref:hypothetical protein n=1 Tax=uncultured Hymenobacter sp. TaxID=170016 RepID=UPI0035CAACD8